MIYKNCAFFKKSLSAIALMGAVFTGATYGMEPGNEETSHTNDSITTIEVINADVNPHQAQIAAMGFADVDAYNNYMAALGASSWRGLHTNLHRDDEAPGAAPR